MAIKDLILKKMEEIKLRKLVYQNNSKKHVTNFRRFKNVERKYQEKWKTNFFQK